MSILGVKKVIICEKIWLRIKINDILKREIQKKEDFLVRKFITCLVGIAALSLGTIHTQAYTLSDYQYSFYEKSNIYGPMEIKTNVVAPYGQVRGGYTHQGIDVAAPMYTPVFAVASGVVTKASPDSKGVDAGGGHMIFIDHEDGSQSWYMHLSTYAVEVGDRVSAGDVIGLSGASGDVTGPHLHFEYRVNGIPYDPHFIFESFGLFENQQVTPSIGEESFKARQE